MSLTFALKITCLATLVVVFAVGTFQLVDYSSRPGISGDVQVELASVDGLPEEVFLNDEPTIVVFYHPHCPCTQAVARCLERLSTVFSGKPVMLAFAFCPSELPEDWIRTVTTSRLECISRCTVFVDRDAERCKQFGAEVSGHVLVYDREGKLVFSGGVTPFRGHEGDSLASKEFVHQVNGPQGELTHWPVFGCPIVEPSEQNNE